MEIRRQDLPLMARVCVRDVLEHHNLNFNDGDKLPMDEEIQEQEDLIPADLVGEDGGPRVTIWEDDHEQELSDFVNQYTALLEVRQEVLDKALEYRKSYDKAKHARNGHMTIALQIKDKLKRADRWWVSKENMPQWQTKEYQAIVARIKALYEKEGQSYEVHKLLNELIRIQVKRDSLCQRYTETTKELRDLESFHWEKFSEAKEEAKKIWENRKDPSDLWEEFFFCKEMCETAWKQQSTRVQAQYWRLFFHEFNRWGINGDTEEVDEMVRLRDEREHMEDIRLAHNRDQDKYLVRDEDSIGFWDWDYLIDFIESKRSTYRSRLVTSQFWNLYRLAKRNMAIPKCRGTLDKLAKLSNPKTRGWWFREEWWVKACKHEPEAQEERLTIKMGRKKGEPTVKELEACIPLPGQNWHDEAPRHAGPFQDKAAQAAFDAADKAFWDYVESR
jgi:hypothetical protein